MSEGIRASGRPPGQLARRWLIPLENIEERLRGRVRRIPRPRVAEGRALARLPGVTACIDVSDGLAGDLKKLLGASGVGADLNLDALPLSDAMSAAFDEDVARRFAATGGDDYELCFTSAQSVPPEIAGVPVTAIGTVNDGDRLVCRSAGAIVEVDDSGYRHF